MPAQKKDPSVRARANRASTAATLSPRKGRVPMMPKDRDWHPQTVRWWKDVWSSPMASEWADSDVHNVVLCAMLFDDVWRAKTATARKEAAGEFRLQRKDLGLTPYDRRRLEWTIESADEAKDRGRARRERRTVDQRAAGDPRAALRAVK